MVVPPRVMTPQVALDSPRPLAAKLDFQKRRRVGQKTPVIDPNISRVFHPNGI